MVKLILLRLLQLLLLQSEAQSEKSISNRYYLDYNATSPLSKRVIDFLQSGDFIFGNPSSVHASGKKSKKFINETKDYLFSLFNLKKENFSCVFHSGASEGINAFFKGIALYSFKEKKKCAFFFSTIDHSAVINLEEDLKAFGHEVVFFNVDKNAEFNTDELILNLKKKSSEGFLTVLNFTYINNETGVVWPLELALKIKKETNVLVHVDAVQLVGKIRNWQNLSPDLDAYTFSGHKFGAMKSVGFSFIKKSVALSPWIVGGGQQDSLRAGTENALGIYTLKLALLDIVEGFAHEKSKRAKEILEKLFNNKEKIIIVASDAKIHSLNTVFIILKGHKTIDISMQLDMQGIDVSTGSACSSGIVKENRILLKMGHSSDEALSSLRFSFSPTISDQEIDQIALVLKNAMSSYL